MGAFLILIHYLFVNNCIFKYEFSYEDEGKLQGHMNNWLHFQAVIIQVTRKFGKSLRVI